MSSLLSRIAPWFAVALTIGVIATGLLVSPGAAVLVVAGGLLLVVLGVGYSALDALFAAPEDLAAIADVRESLVADLEREKDAILHSLRELENERDLGKVSPSDFESLDKVLRTRAIDVMKTIDRDLSVYRARAEALVARRSGATPEPLAAAVGPAVAAGNQCLACAAPLDGDSSFCKKCGRPVRCGGCGAPLDADSNFCKKCGAKVESHA